MYCVIYKLNLVMHGFFSPLDLTQCGSPRHALSQIILNLKSLKATRDVLWSPPEALLRPRESSHGLGRPQNGSLARKTALPGFQELEVAFIMPHKALRGLGKLPGAFLGLAMLYNALKTAHTLQTAATPPFCALLLSGKGVKSPFLTHIEALLCGFKVAQKACQTVVEHSSAGGWDGDPPF